MTLTSGSIPRYRRRTDLIRLIAYLSEQRLFFTVNHVFSSVTGRRDQDDFKWFAWYFRN